MNRILIAVFAALTLIVLPGRASAQTSHAANSPKAEIHLSQPLVVGTVTVKPGDYKFQCIKINGRDMLVVKNADDGKEVARVPCEVEELATKTEVSEIRSIARPDGSGVLTAIRIKGEAMAHRVVLN